MHVRNRMNTSVTVVLAALAVVVASAVPANALPERGKPATQVRFATFNASLNRTHEGNSHLDTADFADDAPGNLRVDYVLPSTDLRPLRRHVFWPVPRSDLARLNDASDHHMVWADLLVRRGER